MMALEKSLGSTPTEQLLARLCEQTFLSIWSWPNPFKADRKELCDLIVVFEDHVFLFFDRESKRFDRSDVPIELAWQRWKKDVIDRQISTARGAERYLKSGKPVYLDSSLQKVLPLTILENCKVHKVIVAHGAQAACKEQSPDNIRGSLAISYDDAEAPDLPFLVRLERENIVHVLDSDNLELVLGELDTITDFVAYIVEKERAIRAIPSLVYCGEEDLLAHYLVNFDEKSQSREIGVRDEQFNSLMIAEGEWEGFVKAGPYERRRDANEVSYFWDNLLQKTGRNALAGLLTGGDVFQGKSAIREMAKENRHTRRVLSQRILDAVSKFPDTGSEFTRYVSFTPSSFPGKGYVFLQLKAENMRDYDEYREFRRGLLTLACGAARLKFTDLQQVVGIAIEPPRLYKSVSEDFVLLNCSDWTPEEDAHFREANEQFNFFATPNLQIRQQTTYEFPAERTSRPTKIGRNEPCFCGSGRKFKKCHGST